MVAYDILMMVVSMAAGELLQHIKDKIAGPTADRISEVIQNQEKILSELQNFQFKLEALNAIQSIKYWTKRIDEIIGPMKAKSGKINTNDQAYQLLLHALRDEYSGVRRQTLSLYDAVIGSLSGTAGGNALRVWHDQLYSKVSDRSNFQYFLSDYVTDMDARIGAVAFVLRQGLILSLFTASDKAEAETLRKECETRIRQMMDTTYGTHYPPALRFFKKSYEDAGDQPSLEWFWLKKKGTGGDYLYMEGSGDERMLATGGMPILFGALLPAWKFSLHRNAHALGSMQLLCNWVDDGRQRINLRIVKTSSQWGVETTSSFTTNTGSGIVWGDHYSTQSILFKLIPLEGKELAVDVVPFYPGSKSEAVDSNKTFHSTFIIVTSAPPMFPDWWPLGQR